MMMVPQIIPTTTAAAAATIVVVAAAAVDDEQQDTERLHPLLLLLLNDASLSISCLSLSDSATRASRAAATQLASAEGCSAWCFFLFIYLL